MHFNLINTAIVALGAFSAPVLAGLTVPQIVQNIQALTSRSQALQAPAQSITIVNGPLIIIGLGPFPQIIAGFNDIVSVATGDIGAMQGSASITTVADAKAVADAFREFVRVHQVLLNILIGKAGLFETVPIIGGPVAAALRQIEGVVDSIAFGLIDLVQVTASINSITNDQSSLDGTLTNAINAYSGLGL